MNKLTPLNAKLSAALSTKLAEEIKYEEESQSLTTDPDFLAQFKKAGIWTVRLEHILQSFALDHQLIFCMDE
jgi:hypothetical protein